LKLYTLQDARSVDNYAITKLGMHPMVLMEHAARGVYEELLLRFYPLEAKEVIVLCGNGNNGGDGLALARMLLLEDVNVSVFLLNGAPKTMEAKEELRILKKSCSGIEIFSTPELNIFKKKVNKSVIVVDAVFGSGLKDARLATRIKDFFKIAGTAGYKVSVDVPSGVNIDNGRVCEGAFTADLTVSLALPKLGLYTAPGAVNAGEVVIKSLYTAYPKLRTRYEFVSETLIKELIRPLKRALNSHKGSYGHLAFISPQKGMEGAVSMSALAALRSGAGLLTVVGLNESSNDLRKRMPMLTPEVMLKDLYIKRTNASEIKKFFSNFDALVLGPGYGTQREEELALIIKHADIPAVIDADAINIIAKHPKLYELVKRSDALLTPHPGEFARLCRVDSKGVQDNRLNMLELMSNGAKCSVMLKGYRSLLSSPNGFVYVNSSGGPALAKGGSGDVLSGIAGAFMAQGLNSSEAGVLAMFVHGLSADRVLERSNRSDFGVLPTDVIEELGELIKCLTE